MTVKKTPEGHFVATCDQASCDAVFGPHDLLAPLFRNRLTIANWETSQNRKLHFCGKHRRHRPINLRHQGAIQ